MSNCRFPPPRQFRRWSVRPLVPASEATAHDPWNDAVLSPPSSPAAMSDEVRCALFIAGAAQKEGRGREMRSNLPAMSLISWHTTERGGSGPFTPLKLILIDIASLFSVARKRILRGRGDVALSFASLLRRSFHSS